MKIYYAIPLVVTDITMHLVG